MLNSHAIAMAVIVFPNPGLAEIILYPRDVNPTFTERFTASCSGRNVPLKRLVLVDVVGT
jgi:hypothetical protein